MNRSRRVATTAAHFCFFDDIDSGGPCNPAAVHNRRSPVSGPVVFFSDLCAMSEPTSQKFEQAVAAFDTYHRKDPNTERQGGQQYPAEFLYTLRMTTRLEEFAPGASEAVRLAARCQHIGRWEISRASFPMDRKGYLRWRSEEKAHHARIAEEILRACQYDEETIEEVKSLLLKKGMSGNPQTQLLEDVACLVFIEFYLADFAIKHDEEKVVDILRKTLKKMSERAKRGVADIQLSDAIRNLIGRATTAE